MRSLRRVRVFFYGQRVGTLQEIDPGRTQFTYDPAWLERSDAVPISQTLPLRPEPHVSKGLHPFFENLLPEGWLLELSTKKLRIPKGDVFGLLLATCRDCIGAVELLKLYRLLLFDWWSGNGDMHLKNFSLLTGKDGRHRLSPAYDLVCTDLYPGLDPSLALPICGKKSRLDARTWLRLAHYMKIPDKAAIRVLKAVPPLLMKAGDLVDRSWLPDEMKTTYKEGLGRRFRILDTVA